VQSLQRPRRLNHRLNVLGVPAARKIVGVAIYQSAKSGECAPGWTRCSCPPSLPRLTLPLPASLFHPPVHVGCFCFYPNTPTHNTMHSYMRGQVATVQRKRERLVRRSGKRGQHTLFARAMSSSGRGGVPLSHLAASCQSMQWHPLPKRSMKSTARGLTQRGPSSPCLLGSELQRPDTMKVNNFSPVQSNISQEWPAKMCHRSKEKI
jgi:hypothetical protein